MEILFSAAILGTVIVGVIAILAQTVGISTRVDHEYTAALIAKSRIERLKASLDTNGFAMLTAANFDETDTLLNADGVADNNGDFRRTTIITTGHAAEARLTRAEVTVEYRILGQWMAPQREITITTVFTSIL